MSRAFRLAAVLRVAHILQTQAKADLANAHEQLDQAQDALADAQRRAVFNGPTGPVTAGDWLLQRSTEDLRARAVTEHWAWTEQARGHVDEQQRAYTQARTHHRALERLDELHTQQLAAEDGKREQLLADELAALRTLRRDATHSNGKALPA